MERRGFLGTVLSSLGALFAGTLVLGSKRGDAEGVTWDLSKFQLPDWAGPKGRSYDYSDSCVNQCGSQCGAMCTKQCVVAMCESMCGAECHEMCAAQCATMCGGGVQLCMLQCSDMCALEHGCIMMNCKDGSANAAKYALTALRSFEFRFNLAHIKPEFAKFRPDLIQEFYAQFGQGGDRSLAFPALDQIRKSGR